MPEDRNPPPQLTSWKEIAEHLRVAVRTAQAWERHRGLPVRRMTGKKGRVNADPVELDHWRLSVFQRNHRFSGPRYFKIYAALLSLLLIVAAGHGLTHLLSESRDPSPTSTRIGQQPLVVVDHSKNAHSRKTLSKTDQTKARPRTDSELERMITFQDVDGDGELETILHYTPVKLHAGPNILPGVNEKKEQDQSLAAAPPPTSESSIPDKP